MRRLNSSSDILRSLSWLDFAHANRANGLNDLDGSKGSLGMGGSRGSLRDLRLDSSGGSHGGMCSAPMLHCFPGKCVYNRRGPDPDPDPDPDPVPDAEP